MSSLPISKLYLCDLLFNVKNENRRACSIIDSIKTRYSLDDEQLIYVQQQLDLTFIPIFKNKLNQRVTMNVLLERGMLIRCIQTL